MIFEIKLVSRPIFFEWAFIFYEDGYLYKKIISISDVMKITFILVAVWNVSNERRIISNIISFCLSASN